MMIRRLLTRTWLSILLLAVSAIPALSADALIVQLRLGTSIRTVTAFLGGEVVDQIPGTPIYLISVPALPPSWLPIPGVVFAEPNLSVALPEFLEAGVLVGPEDGAADWYAGQPSLAIVRLAEAQTYSRGADVVVADIDSRFDFDHPAVNGHFTDGYDFVWEREAREAGLDQSSASFLFAQNGLLDQSSASFLFTENGMRLLSPFVRLLAPPQAAYSHGTLTAGLLAVTAPEARIMPIRAFDDQGEADLFTLARSVRYAAENGAQVINMSWGTLVDSPALREAIDYARRRGVVLVTSAGNMNTDQAVYPAAYDGVVDVAATDDRDHKAAFSNFGPDIDVAAPGVNIISSYPGGSYAIVSGTSFSSPIVAGEAALLRSAFSSGIESRIKDGSVNIDRINPEYAGQLGRGRIDMEQSIRKPGTASGSEAGPGSRLFRSLWGR